MPDLPPVEERFTADASQYVAALEAMAAAAERAARAQAQIVAGIEAMNAAMDAAAAGAEEAAAAEERLAEAEGQAAEAAAEQAAADDAAAGAADNLARANDGAAAASFTLARFQRTLADALMASFAAERAAANAADASREAFAGLAAAEAAAAQEAEKLAEAETAGSLAAYQDAEAAKVFAEADAAAAAAAALLDDVVAKQTATMAANAAATVGLAAATDAAGKAAGRAWGPWWLLGNNWKTALHWIVAGSAELLAVAIPALIALGAGAFVALQGAQNLQRHFTALYAATESTSAAFHTTVGDVLGLGHAFQTAQNQANPGVYELLGSVINDARTHFADFASTGLQVVHMLDEFSARVTVDLQGALGAQLHTFLGNMVTDLRQLGQVLGNFGHALLNVFSAMPGLVHILLGAVDAFSQFVLWVSRAPAGLLTFAIAMEEVFRWGGLLLGVFARLANAQMFAAFAEGGGFITRFGAALKTLVVQAGLGIAALGGWIARLPVFTAEASAAGAAVDEFGMQMAVAGEAMSTNMIALAIAGAAALVFLVAKLASAKTATEQWVASSSQMVAKASDLNVLPTIYSQLAETTTRLAASQGTLATQTGIVNARFATGRNAVVGASEDSLALANHLMSLVTTAQTVRNNIGLLAGAFHISAVGALALANAAGVNLQAGMTRGSEALKIAVQQINNLRAGLGAMSAPIGVIGADMEAMGVQSQLTATKVGQVNQAFDQFIGTLTGGMSGLSQFEAALSTMGHDALSSSVGIDGAIRSISRSAQQMGFTLQGFGPKAQQSWQQFAQAVNQGQQVLDTFRTGMAEGMVSAGQYNRAIMDVAGSLLPFAAHSRTATAIVSALAQEAGLPATSSFRTLAGQIGVTGKTARDQLAAGMEQAIIRMSNLSAVARNLSATVSGQLDSAMASAIVKASGLDQAYLKWATDVKSNAAPQTLAADLRAIRSAQDFVNTATAKGTTLLNQSSKAASGLGDAYKKMASDTATATARTSDHVVALDRARGASAEASAKAAQLSANMQQNASVTQRATTAAQGASVQVQHLGSVAIQTRAQVGDVNNEIRTMPGVAGAASSAMARLAASISVAGSRAGAATGQVRGLESAISALSSKTITITTNMVTTHSTRAAGGPVVPGLPYLVGEQGQELFVPAQAGFIVPHNQTQKILAATATSSSGQAGRPIVVTAHGDVHAHVMLDGQEIATAIQPYQLQYAHRNGRQITALA